MLNITDVVGIEEPIHMSDKQIIELLTLCLEISKGKADAVFEYQAYIAGISISFFADGVDVNNYKPDLTWRFYADSEYTVDIYLDCVTTLRQLAEKESH